jgi:hypothetical protein
VRQKTESCAAIHAWDRAECELNKCCGRLPVPRSRRSGAPTGLDLPRVA